MCERCLEIAMAIDPEIIKAMQEAEPEYRALQAKLSTAFKAILKHEVEVVDQDDEPLELDAEREAEVNAQMTKFSGHIGMAHALGWFIALDASDQMELAMYAGPTMNMLNQSFNGGNAYRYLLNQQKH